MPSARVVVETKIRRSGRVSQVEGLFDVPRSDTAKKEWLIDLPLENIEWNIGLVVGPSGSGKSTCCRELFGVDAMMMPKWSIDAALVDDFADGMSIKSITAALSAVGLSSPPTWLKPYHVLSTGEKFRCDCARLLSESDGRVIVIDEYTSVVDRQVACVTSNALQKTIRAQKKKMIVVTCHYDVEPWLNPDWVFDMQTLTFTRRELRQRPSIDVEIERCDTSAWQLFKAHHYLSHAIHRAATCFVASVNGSPVVFVAVMPFPHATAPGWRTHRVVTLPDWQGLGLGMTVHDYVASLYAAKGTHYGIVTTLPSLIRSLAKSRNWKMIAKPKLSSMIGRTTTINALRKTVAMDRLVGSFRYVGKSREADAIAFGVVKSRQKNTTSTPRLHLAATSTNE